jgi:predicted Zn-dependent protease with MMP-like domain
VKTVALSLSTAGYPRTVFLPSDRFEDLVRDALDSLPESIAAMMDNVEVVVEEEPPDELLAGLPAGHILLGYYHGVPLTRRENYQSVLPDKISVYRGPILRSVVTEDDVRDEVRRTVIHEIAHHFGIDDDRLEEFGWA